jgi:5,10-methenyltetrahydromethanopterin hydrogenase
MEWIFGGLIKMLGTAGFGTVFGGIMGYFNRKTDIQFKKLEIEDNEKARAHELKQREIDAKIMREEYQGKIQVAEMEGSFKAIEKSYEFAQPDKGSAMGKFSAFVRPFISLCYFVVTSLGAAWILWYAFEVVQIEFTRDQWFDLAMFIIDWVTFMASACIGWWYAMRAGTAPKRK